MNIFDKLRSKIFDPNEESLNVYNEIVDATNNGLINMTQANNLLELLDNRN